MFFETIWNGFLTACPKFFPKIVVKERKKVIMVLGIISTAASLHSQSPHNIIVWNTIRAVPESIKCQVAIWHEKKKGIRSTFYKWLEFFFAPVILQFLSVAFQNTTVGISLPTWDGISLDNRTKCEKVLLSLTPVHQWISLQLICFFSRSLIKVKHTHVQTCLVLKLR